MLISTEPADYIILEEEESLKGPLSEVFNNSFASFLFDDQDRAVMVLDEYLQLVAYSKNLLMFPGQNVPVEFASRSVGEYFSCKYADNNSGGCGFSKHCQFCGFRKAIEKSRSTGKPVRNESSMVFKNQDLELSAEFKVKAAPFKVKSRNLTFVVLIKISNEKKKNVLERVFFHDIKNYFSGLLGWSDLLQGMDGKEDKKILRKGLGYISLISKAMFDEIDFHHQLSRAESGDLIVDFESIPVKTVFDEIEVIFSHQFSENKVNLDINRNFQEFKFKSNLSLLIKVLSNMVKNAMEAVQPGATVQLWFEKTDKSIRFNVKNETVIPEDVAVRIFKRFYSTKSTNGRGLGTYSMKLFGERYLKGTVSFVSTEETGTIFSIELPQEITIFPK